MRDRYACLQESTQRVSGAYVNQYGGASDSRVVVSRGMFLSCMGARGYVPGLTGTFAPPPGTEVFFTAN